MRVITTTHSFCRVEGGIVSDVRALQWAGDHGILVGRAVMHDEDTSVGGGLTSLMHIRLPESAQHRTGPTYSAVDGQ